MATSILSYVPTEIISFGTAFVFVFAVVFALLVYSGVFARKDKTAPKAPLAAIAAVVAIVSAMYEPFVMFMQQFLPLASIALVVLFFFVFVQQLVKKQGKGDPWPAMIGLALFLLVIGMLWERIQISLGISAVSPDTVLWIMGIAAVILIFFLAYSTTQKQEK